MNKKGFTLVELLAVLFILAIIALITIPVIMNVFQSSKENAFIDTAHGLVISAGTYQAEKQALKEDETLYINYKTSSEEEKDVLKTSGTLPDAGEFEINSDGKVTLALWSDDAKVCVVKKANEKEIKIDENITSSDKCLISNIE